MSGYGPGPLRNRLLELSVTSLRYLAKGPAGMLLVVDVPADILESTRAVSDPSDEREIWFPQIN